MEPIRVKLATSGADEVEGQIVGGIPPSGRSHILRLWRPFIQACKEDDAKWPWRWIVAPTEGTIELALLREGRMEGVMKLRRTSNCRELANLGQTCCSVEYVAVAPWNRPPATVAIWTEKQRPADKDCGAERAKPCGRLLFGAAMHLSKSFGHEGRLGWLAEPGAVPSYREWFPEILGGKPDVNAGGYPWFEITSQMASHFLTEISGSSSHELANRAIRGCV